MNIKQCAAFLLLGAVVLQPAYAQTAKYPDRPIRLIAPFPPGGSVDVTARLIGPKVTEAIGQQVIIDNRSGASGIVGTNPHIAGELFNLMAKTDIVAVQFKGGGPALVGALSGEVGVSFSAVAGAVSYMNTKRLRPLGVTSLKPIAALPTVPPIADTLPGYEFTAWFAVVAPKGTNPEIISKLNETFRKAMSSPDFVKRFEAEGLEVIGSTPEQLGTFLDAELKKWARVIKERKMKAE